MKNQLSPPGRLINVNGRKVHVQQYSTGFPAVVFESGLFDDSFTFANVQPQVAKLTSTISYDRAGVGYSEQSPNPKRNCTVMASELYELLETLGLHKPLVLVGWSAGGIYIREFARHHPEMVAGMVFIDSSHENIRNRVPDKLALIGQQDQDDLIEYITRLSKMTHEEILKDVADSPPWKNRHPDTHKYYEDRARPELLEYFLQLAPFFFEEDIDQDKDAIKSLGDIPLVVISKSRNDNPRLNEKQKNLVIEFRGELQNELAELSTASRQIKVDCGHDIANEKPEVVIKAIEDVVKQVRRSN